MKLARRIKRKIRNIRLSKFAENIYFASWHTDCLLFVHPLVYEIIRFRYPENMPPRLMENELLLKDDYFYKVVVGNVLSDKLEGGV